MVTKSLGSFELLFLSSLKVEAARGCDTLGITSNVKTNHGFRDGSESLAKVEQVNEGACDVH